MTPSDLALHADAPPECLTTDGDHLLRLYERLFESLGESRPPTRIFEALRQSDRDNPGPWQDVWVKRTSQTLDDLGYSAEVDSMTLAEALDASNSRVLLALMDSEEGAQWVILDNGKTRFFQLEDKAHQAVELHQSKSPAVAPTAASKWISVTPSRPFESLRASEVKSPHHGPKPFRRLLMLLGQERNDIWVIVLFSLGIGIFSLATPIAVEAIVATVQGGTQILLQPVVALSIVLLAFLSLAAVLRVMKAFVVEYIQQRLFVRVVVDLANRLPQVKQEALDREHGPELVNRFFDVLTIQKASAVLLVDGLSVVLQTVIGLVVLAFFNPFLLGFDIVLLGAITFIIFVLGRGAVRTSIAESYAKYDVAGWLEEIIRHPLTFKVGGGRQFALLKANELAGKYIHARRSHFKILFRQILFALMLQAFASAALFGLGGWLVINRGLTLGQLVAAELILAVIVGSLIKLGKSLESYYDLLAAVDKLGHLIDLPLEKMAGETIGRRGRPAAIAIRNLSFRFQAHPERPVINNLNIRIEAGESLAVTGPHGAGKSAVLELLFGLREPISGTMEFDGVDYRHVRLESLRHQVSLVKGVEVFEGNVMENVDVGRGHSPDEIRAALDAVELLDELRDLPDGLETQLTTGGIPLSYGQVRRLMIARAIVNRPRLLLIDEALDDLHDTIRDKVLDNLTSPDAPWTLATATHSEIVVAKCSKRLELGKAR